MQTLSTPSSRASLCHRTVAEMLADSMNALLVAYAILNALLAVYLKGRLDRRRGGAGGAGAAARAKAAANADDRDRPLLRDLPSTVRFRRTREVGGLFVWLHVPRGRA